MNLRDVRESRIRQRTSNNSHMQKLTACARPIDDGMRKAAPATSLIENAAYIASSHPSQRAPALPGTLLRRCVAQSGTNGGSRRALDQNNLIGHYCRFLLTDLRSINTIHLRLSRTKPRNQAAFAARCDTRRHGAAGSQESEISFHVKRIHFNSTGGTIDRT